MLILQHFDQPCGSTYSSKRKTAAAAVIDDAILSMTSSEIGRILPTNEKFVLREGDHGCIHP